MILPGNEIKRLIKGIALVNNIIDNKIQIQPNGMDITVKEIYELSGNGAIDFDNSKRKLPERKEIEFENDKVELDKGCYIVKINEMVNIPKDLCALVFPRSSLLRMGVEFQTAVWDAGYNGQGELLMVVHNPVVIYKNARLGQMIVLKLVKPVEEGYNGIYNEKNKKEVK